MLNSDFLIEIFNEYKSFSILISLLLNIIIALLGFLPSIFITTANILFFGPFYGFFISLSGEVIGAYISFLAYRKSFKNYTKKLSSKFNVINKLIISSEKEAGFFIFQGRLFPMIPSGLVTLASSVSNVDALTFTIATFLGKIPSIALEVLIGYQILNIEKNYINLFISLILIIITFIYFKSKNKKLKESN